MLLKKYEFGSPVVAPFTGPIKRHTHEKIETSTRGSCIDIDFVAGDGVWVLCNRSIAAGYPRMDFVLIDYRSRRHDVPWIVQGFRQSIGIFGAYNTNHLLQTYILDAGFMYVE